jgi:hypothetical protein
MIKALMKVMEAVTRGVTFFAGPTSWDLRSHRLGYHYGIAFMGLKHIFLDAASITLRDCPLVNRYVRFFSVWI